MQRIRGLGKATKGGRLVCASNGDDNIGFFSGTVMVFPETGNAFIASPYNMPGFGGFPSHPGMNSKGLVHVHHGTGKFVFPIGATQAPEASPTCTSFASRIAPRKQLRYSSPIRKPSTARMATSRRCERRRMVIESQKPTGHTPRRATCDKAWISSTTPTTTWRGPTETIKNRTTSPTPVGSSKELKGLEEMDLTAWSVSRNLFMWNMLHNYQGEVDLDFATMMYRFPSTIARPTLEAADEAYGPERRKSCHAT